MRTPRGKQNKPGTAQQPLTGHIPVPRPEDEAAEYFIQPPAVTTDNHEEKWAEFSLRTMVATHGLAKAGDERCCEFERDLMSLRGAVAYGMDESIIQERAARLGSHVQSLSVLMRAMHACYCRAVGYLLKGAEGHYKQRVRGLALRLEAITPGETADRLQRYVAALEAYFADDPDAKWGAACAHIADDEPDAPSTDGVRKFLARHGVIDRTFIR